MSSRCVFVCGSMFLYLDEGQILLQVLKHLTVLTLWEKLALTRKKKKVVCLLVGWIKSKRFLVTEVKVRARFRCRLAALVMSV